MNSQVGHATLIRFVPPLVYTSQPSTKHDLMEQIYFKCKISVYIHRAIVMLIQGR